MGETLSTRGELRSCTVFIKKYGAKGPYDWPKRKWYFIKINGTGLWDVTPCSLVDGCRSFGGILKEKYSHARHNDVSVNGGPHIRRWSRKIIILSYTIL